MTRSPRASDALTQVEVALLAGRNLGQIECEISESSTRDDKPPSRASPNPGGDFSGSDRRGAMQDAFKTSTRTVSARSPRPGRAESGGR
jgi:hypothetical protein